MTNRRELADRLEADADVWRDLCDGVDPYSATIMREAARLLREPVAGEVLRVVGVAHMVRTDHLDKDDTRGVFDLMVSAPAPARHGNLFPIGYTMLTDNEKNSGFLLSDGTFADRYLAWKVAEAAGQIIGQPPVPGKLFSEDVW